MTSDELRNSFYFIFERAERSLLLVWIVAPTPRRATSTIRSAEGGLIVIRHFMKFHMSNNKYQMVRQVHNLTTLSQVEGQITMTDPPEADQTIGV